MHALIRYLIAVSRSIRDRQHWLPFVLLVGALALCLLRACEDAYCREHAVMIGVLSGVSWMIGALCGGLARYTLRATPSELAEPMGAEARRAGIAGLLVMIVLASGCIRTADGRLVPDPGTVAALGCVSERVVESALAALTRLVGSAAAGHGAGTTDEWRAFGTGLAATHGPATARCLVDVLRARLLAQATAEPVATHAPASSSIGFVQPGGASGGRALGARGELDLEASATPGARAGEASGGSVTAAAGGEVMSALQITEWLRAHPREWIR